MEDNNIFMLCRKLDNLAFKKLDKNFTVRNLEESEIEIWKTIHFDTYADKKDYRYIVDEYYNNYFSDRKNEFLNACKVICDVNNNILGTCFLWKISAGMWSVQWFKIVNQYVNKGIGRQLLSYVLNDDKLDLPIILHTHSVSFPAIKLYSDFGFEFLTDNYVGSRKNGLNASLNLIRKHIKLKELHFTSLSDSERERLASFDSEDF
ncbi:hypothetical protein GCM10025886_02310 [Tetragenococcus halophilus subsp. flandriensis]|uniref:GNAT family N-acetyltransferase n=1 Tax=Tetragenococcus halophilus TaxID=51669 RepID=UPI0023EA1F04|nr:GNAT family N-acetyltransferase [Tetragenococcus halophilus]GMA07080.1 hypothetical protein GCM10025886_02310 [Tetragenococcus halophilus subsp. flandriensis]